MQKKKPSDDDFAVKLIPHVAVARNFIKNN